MEPEQGGETLFTDLQAAYTTLPEEVKNRIEHLRTIHRNGVIHPLVLRHPGTGVPALYLNVGLTAGVLQMSPTHSAALMQYIDQH